RRIFSLLMRESGGAEAAWNPLHDQSIAHDRKRHNNDFVVSSRAGLLDLKGGVPIFVAECGPHEARNPAEIGWTFVHVLHGQSLDREASARRQLLHPIAA